MPDVAGSVDERAFVASVRKLSKGRDVLFHGTCYGRQILAENRLRHPLFGSEAVSFTRSPEVAVYWALLERTPREEIGAVLILDRWRLRTRYRLEQHHDPIWDREDSINDEAEERVLQQDISNLTSFMIGVVWVDGTVNEPDHRPTSPHQFWSEEDIARLERLADSHFPNSPRPWRRFIGELVDAG